MSRRLSYAALSKITRLYPSNLPRPILTDHVISSYIKHHLDERQWQEKSPLWYQQKTLEWVLKFIEKLVLLSTGSKVPENKITVFQVLRYFQKSYYIMNQPYLYLHMHAKR